MLIKGDKAVLILPNGTRTSVTNPKIAVRAGTFPTWEVYQNNALTESKAAFTEVWAG